MSALIFHIDVNSAYLSWEATYWLYMKCSVAMNIIFQEYTPQNQRFSIDESFLDFSNMEHLYPNYRSLAETIKERIKKELGFTVNIGISNNKLLAKVASDFKKPDRIHTLFPSELLQCGFCEYKRK